MLVVPALLSLKPSVAEKPASEFIDLISSVTKKLQDPQEIVAKTSRKLILELEKCYKGSFESKAVDNIRNDEER